MTDPDPSRGTPRRPRRAIRPGTEREAIAGPSVHERDPAPDATAGPDTGADSNDERLRRDVPPHY